MGICIQAYQWNVLSIFCKHYQKIQYFIDHVIHERNGLFILLIPWRGESEFFDQFSGYEGLWFWRDRNNVIKGRGSSNRRNTYQCSGLIHLKLPLATQFTTTFMMVERLNSIFYEIHGQIKKKHLINIQAVQLRHHVTKRNALCVVHIASSLQLTIHCLLTKHHKSYHQVYEVKNTVDCCSCIKRLLLNTYF